MNEEAEKLKASANEVFKKRDYERAIGLYTEAINIAPEEPVLYSNRSIAYLKSEAPGAALQDANQGFFILIFLKKEN